MEPLVRNAPVHHFGALLGRGSWGGCRGGGSVGSHTSIPKSPDSGSCPCGLIAHNPRPGHTFSRAQAVQGEASGMQGLAVAVSFLSMKNLQEVHSFFFPSKHPTGLHLLDSAILHVEISQHNDYSVLPLSQAGKKT